MEFYANYSSGILAATEGFNSQRDGILRPLFALSLLHEAVSIPNGMEFYQKGSKNDRTRISFQFPTGWNSTNLSSNTATADTVSIPNGMEFYRSKSFAMMRRLRFNSQRDGILPFFTFFLCTQASFNSQRDGILHKNLFHWILLEQGFNSQRDGILHCHIVAFIPSKLFQFPTGWNSTEIASLVQNIDELFQFPTGWNSTMTSAIFMRLFSRFQFPTGWNSTRA